MSAFITLLTMCLVLSVGLYLLLRKQKVVLPDVTLQDVINAIEDREDVFGIGKNAQILPDGETRLGNKNVQICYFPYYRNDSILVEKISLAYRDVEYCIYFHNQGFAVCQRDGVSLPSSPYALVSRQCREIYDTVRKQLPKEAFLA